MVFLHCSFCFPHILSALLWEDNTSLPLLSHRCFPAYLLPVVESQEARDKQSVKRPGTCMSPHLFGRTVFQEESMATGPLTSLCLPSPGHLWSCSAEGDRFHRLGLPTQRLARYDHKNQV
ncbi:hypothetical protein INR49_019261 [Caranx melampygus]|nr:hypothetical protein INR49_019261 [Caranx melampygus]